MSAARLLDDGEVFVWTIDPDATWAYSRFPHPLLTVDYDANDTPFQLVAIGPKAAELDRHVCETTLAALKASDDPAIADDFIRALEPA